MESQDQFHELRRELGTIDRDIASEDVQSLGTYRPPLASLSAELIAMQQQLSTGELIYLLSVACTINQCRFSFLFHQPELLPRLLKFQK
jgi:hypothetical protein